MNLKTTFAHAGDGLVQVRKILRSDNCSKDDFNGKLAKWNLLQTLINAPSLGVCGNQDFEGLKVFYDGTAWILEMEAVVSDKLYQNV